MQRTRRFSCQCISQTLCAIILVLAIVWVPHDASALDTGQAQTVDGLSIYLGVMPAEIVKGHPQAHTEASAHGGPPSGMHEYHILIAIFDSTTSARISDANVFARVSSLGLTGPRKALEPMKIADTSTYGNYFNLPDKGPYTINVEINRLGSTVRVDFAYEHY